MTEAIQELTECVKDLKNLINKTNEGGTEFPTQPDFSEVDPSTLHPCGGTPGWRRVAYLNMSDTRYLCPASWRHYPGPPRACGRASHEELTCDSVSFSVYGGTYDKICGRVEGYQFGATAGFYASHLNNSITIDESYVTGVSITHGSPRNHVWTYAAGRYEGVAYTSINVYRFCPCEHIREIFIPQYVGAYWYCESGDNSNYGTSGYNVFSDDILWDGEDCLRPNKCCQFAGPVYFTRKLQEHTADPIEVRICNYYTSQYSDVLLSHLELYVK